MYNMELSIGGQQFYGKGRTRQAAKHDAAAKALKSLHKEPLLQQLPEVSSTFATLSAFLAQAHKSFIMEP